MLKGDSFMRGYEFDFDIKSGFSIYRIEHLHGEVIGKDKYTETVVSGSASGRNESVFIRSRSYTHVEFSLKIDDGSEEDVKVIADIPIRNGHKVTLIRAVSDTNQYNVILINHTLDKYYQITPVKKLYVLNGLYALIGMLAPILYVRLFLSIAEGALFDIGAWVIALLIGLIPGLVMVALVNAILSFSPSRKAATKLQALTDKLILNYYDGRS